MSSSKAAPPTSSERKWSGAGSTGSTKLSDATTSAAGVVRDRSYAEPFRTLFRQVLEVMSNRERFMLIPDEGRVSYEPNPWHADPVDATLIGLGMKNVWDRIGAAAGIGPAPVSVAEPSPEGEQAPRRPPVV